MSSPQWKILYIEDDQANRQLVNFIVMRREDLLLLEAETGNDGLRLVREQKPDIILLDLSLPDISGYEVLDHIQSDSTTSSIPVICVSGDNLPQDIEKGLEAGFSDYIGKPIDVIRFYNIIDKTLDSLTD